MKQKNPNSKKPATDRPSTKAGSDKRTLKFKLKKKIAAEGKRGFEKRDRRAIEATERTARQELGLFRVTKEGGRVTPTNKRAKSEIFIPKKFQMDAEDGQLVLVEIEPSDKLGLPNGKVLEIVGHIDDPKAYSMIAIYENDIPNTYPVEAVAQARAAQPTGLGKRTDLRSYPLVTIDGEDARDFDDAVFAEPDADHPGGWHLLVAIADVAHYVRPGDPLDREAYKRGNSVYFPDRVVPMLPEELSNELCSLKPKVERATMAVHLWIDGEGQLARYQFVRGLMKSIARLTYTQVQAAYDGTLDDTTREVADPVLKNLFSAYKVLRRARDARGTLELELPEYKARIVGGTVESIDRRTQQESNKLIEEFMILANVAAASAIEDRANKVGAICLYRIHDAPPDEKREMLAEFLSSIGGKLPKGNKLTPKGLSQILSHYRETPEAPLVNEMMLRSQSRATYSPDNIGHFGLALPRYAHFTSPIRRYADLLVHRALIRAYNLGDDGLPPEQAMSLDETGEHLAVTEQRAATAERSATERYVASYLAGQVGTTFAATISGVTHFGLFVRLNDTGADGLLPIRSLGEDYFIHDEGAQMLVGRRTGVSYKLGQPLTVRLLAAEGLTGRLELEIVGGETTGSKRKVRPEFKSDKGKPKGGDKRKLPTGKSKTKRR